MVFVFYTKKFCVLCAKQQQLPLQLSMSIGYAFWHEAGRRGENLIQQADERMYEEKQKKKRMRA